MLIPALLGILLCTMLAWIIIFSKGPVLLKVCAIPPAVLYCTSLFVTMPSMLGWPSRAELPEKFEVLWVKVKPPVGGKEGRILVWCRSIKPNEHAMLSMYHPKPDDSRLYSIPYSKGAHKEANKATDMLKRGQRVMGERGSGKMNGKSKKGKTGKKGKGKGGKGKKGNKHGGHEGEESNPDVPFTMYKFPPIVNPPKGK